MGLQDHKARQDQLELLVQMEMMEQTEPQDQQDHKGKLV